MVPAKNIAEFIAYVKANPKKVHFGTAGIGSPQHMAGLLLNREAGIDLIHVPYKGGGPAVNDAIGGHIQAVIATVSSTLGQHKGGMLRIIGIGEKERFAASRKCRLSPRRCRASRRRRGLPSTRRPARRSRSSMC